MNRETKVRIAVCLAFELAVSAFIAGNVCLLRSDEVRERIEWKNHPTQENRAKLDHQKRITLFETAAVGGLLWLGMAAVTVPVVIARSRRTKLESTPPTA